MTKATFLFLLLHIFPLTVLAQDTAYVAWVREYPGPDGACTGGGLTTDGDGNVYVVGGTYEPTPRWDVVTIKYDGLGDEEWVARYNRNGNYSDNGSAIVVDHIGNIFSAGGSGIAGGPYSDYTLLSYDSDGGQRWNVHYNGEEDWIDIAVDLVLGPGGEIYVTGQSDFGTTTIKYDINGEVEWISHHDGGYPRAMAIDDSQNIFVASYFVMSEDSDYLTIKINSGGEEEWAVRYDHAEGEPYLYDMAYDIVADNEGGAFVTGTSDDVVLGSQTATLRYDSDGNVEWIRRGGAGSLALHLDQFGFLYVGGRTDEGKTGDDIAVVKYDFQGDTVWTATYDGAGGEDFAVDLESDQQGNVFVTGSSYGPDLNHDFATIKIDSNGSIRWVSRYAGPEDASDHPKGISLTGLGEIVVTGLTHFNDNIITTVKYLDPEVVSVSDQAHTPSLIALHQNYPNPFNPSTTIRFELPRSGEVSLKVFNLLGEEVAALGSGHRDAGTHTVQWDATGYPSGVYFYRLRAGEFVETKKLVLVK